MAKRILIADDSVTIQKAFAMTFAGADDVTVTSARSADEGLAVAQKVQPDLVIADGVMPGRSGYDLCAAIRSDPGLRTVPVFILASSQQPYDEARGQKAGANGHLLKPWDTNAILDKIRESLRGPGEPGTVPSAGPSPAGRPAASLSAALADDEYGEISIDERDTDQRARVPTPAPVESRSRLVTPPPPPPGRNSSPSISVGSPPAASPVRPAPGSAAPTLRPSLIPGMRPGSVPPARPGTIPVRPTATSMPAVGPAGGAAPPRPAAPPVGRTMIGLPAANIPIPGVMRPSSPPGSISTAAPLPGSVPMPHAAPPRSPVTPMPPMTPVRSAVTPMPPMAPVRPPTAPVAPLATRPPATANAIIDQKVAAFAAKGPEYEALAKLSREVIEQIVWEIVPELAEAIIRAEVEKRGRI